MIRIRPVYLIIGLVILIPLVGVAWWLVSPLFLNRTVEESFPLSATATIPENMTQAEVEAVMAGMAKVEFAASDDMPAQDNPIEIARGQLQDADSFHRGSGGAIIYQFADGTSFLRLEEIEVTNGPDLHVILSAHPQPSNQRELKEGDYVDLGQLKGNRGSQNYEIPGEVELSGIQSVVIYCMPFHVVFSTATLMVN